MTIFDRAIVGVLVASIWTLIAIQSTGNSHAQEPESNDTNMQPRVVTIHATDIVGLSAFVQQAVRDHQFRPQTMPGLDQYVRSVVRNCRISGSVSGGRLSATNISC